jgi:hypothetical protein
MHIPVRHFLAALAIPLALTACEHASYSAEDVSNARAEAREEMELVAEDAYHRGWSEGYDEAIDLRPTDQNIIDEIIFDALRDDPSTVYDLCESSGRCVDMRQQAYDDGYWDGVAECIRGINGSGNSTCW